MSVTIDLSNKRALVTGGTRGIGKEISKKLLQAGAHVTVTGTKESEISNLSKSNKISNLDFNCVDFTSNESTVNFLNHIANSHGYDILINNAGINIVSDFLLIDDNSCELINKVNLTGPLKLCKELVPYMQRKNWGRIINVASIWSVVSREGRSLYSTSKNALLGLTRSIALEFASKNILVNAVSPGFTLTELTLSTNTQEDLKVIENEIPMKRLAMPEEIANCVLFLVSDFNQYLTGQNIVIDGGYTIQ